jgi:hypothetical protein
MEGAWVVGEYVCTRILSCVVLFFRGGNITEMSFGITEGYVARYALTIAICIGRFLQLKKRMRDAAGVKFDEILYPLAEKTNTYRYISPHFHRALISLRLVNDGHFFGQNESHPFQT